MSAASSGCGPSWPAPPRRSGWCCGPRSCWPPWRGHSTAAIARELGVTEDTVRKWRRRFVRDGMPGLRDAPRAGHPPVYGLGAQLLIVATVTAEPPDSAQWTHRLLAEHLDEPLGVSASQIGRILACPDLKPHRVRGWLNRPVDPEFTGKAQAVCARYLNPPSDAVLFSVDEKTAVQATSRKRSTRAMRRGRPELREFEYVRHGTASLMAAMNVTDGAVHPKSSTATTQRPSPSSSPTCPRPSTRPRRSTSSWTTDPATPPNRPRPGSPSTPASR